MGMSSGDPSEPSASINVTPLVDVCLVLLIIFMVVVNQNVAEIRVHQPERASGPTPPLGRQPVVLHINAAGEIDVSGTPVELAQLHETIEGALAEQDQRAVWVDVAPEVRYGDAARAMEVARAAGGETLQVRRLPGGEAIPQALLPI